MKYSVLSLAIAVCFLLHPTYRAMAQTNGGARSSNEARQEYLQNQQSYQQSIQQQTVESQKRLEQSLKDFQAASQAASRAASQAASSTAGTADMQEPSQPTQIQRLQEQQRNGNVIIKPSEKSKPKNTGPKPIFGVN